MKKKLIYLLSVGLFLPTFLIEAMAIFSQIVIKKAEIWAEKAMEISLIQRLLLSFAYFIHENFIFLVLTIVILCLSAAVIILILGKNDKQ